MIAKINSLFRTQNRSFNIIKIAKGNKHGCVRQNEDASPFAILGAKSYTLAPIELYILALESLNWLSDILPSINSQPLLENS